MNIVANKMIASWRDLGSMDFGFNQPFVLQLDNNENIQAERVARLMPGRRVVVFGKWRNKDIVAKIFFDSQHAMRHVVKEEKGFTALKERKILTPELLYRGVSEDRRIHALIYEQITPTHHLQALVDKPAISEQEIDILKKIMVEIATQHVLGVMQKDLHLDNFLIAGDKIYTLDAMQVVFSEEILPRKPSMENLSLFLSQLAIDKTQLQEKLFEHYVKTRGWVVSTEDVEQLNLLIKQHQLARWESFRKKITRNCSDYKNITKFNHYIMYRRNCASDEFLKFIKNPELAFEQPDKEILKAGRSSSVIKIELDGVAYVVKRFNMKNIWHRLRRCLRSTRAAHDWQIAHKLVFFGINTARPVAYIENTFLGLKGKSYYVMEYVAGQSLDKYLALHPENKQEAVTRTVRLLKNLARIELTHGDLKITNILMDKNDQPLLIDLDGSQEHVSINGLRAAWKKEIKRFLRNFDDDKELQQLFRKQLEA